MARDVQNHFVLEFFLDGNADGLGDVRFPEARTSEEEQRVKGCLARSVGNFFGRIDAQLVAIPFHQVAEAVHRIETGVDLETLDSREHEGTGAAGGLVRGHRHRIVGGNGALIGGKNHSFLVLDRTDQIEQLALCADSTLDGEPEQFLIGILYILAEEIRGNLYGELGSFQGHRPDELEPGIELLRINVVFYDLQTVIPYRNMSFLAGHQGVRKK